MDDACHYLKERGLQGNHSTIISYQSSMCKEQNVAEVDGEEIGQDETIKIPKDSPKLLVWSAADEKGILRIQNTWKSSFSAASTFDEAGTKFLDNLAHTLSARRTPFSWRTFAVSRQSDSLASLSDKFSSAVHARTSPTMAMIFSGVNLIWLSSWFKLMLTSL
jgi:hypothetical protein